MKNLISIKDFNKQSLEDFFNGVETYQLNLTRKELNIYDKKLLANLFYEPSTRTSSSFFAAAKKLGHDVLPINNVQYSSVTKGESLEDTIITLGCYVDLIILRHPEVGACKRAVKVSSVPVINAGDGIGEHPTQTLIDLYTIWKRFKTIDGLTITFMGDLKNGRTIHSLLEALKLYDVKINLISPNNLRRPLSIRLESSTVEYSSLVETVARDTDVLYVTRLQRERDNIGDYSYILNQKDFSNLKHDMIVMHPFPREKEIPVTFDSDPRAYYFNQIKNGLYVRMAILNEMLNDIY